MGFTHTKTAVDLQKLLTYFLTQIVVIDGWLGLDAGLGKGCEQVGKPVVRPAWHSASPRSCPDTRSPTEPCPPPLWLAS